MRQLLILTVTIGLFMIPASHARGDDLKINTPVVEASLRGQWELEPEKAEGYKQTLTLGPQFT